MKKIVDQEIKGKIRVTVFDDDTARVDGLVYATIDSINIDHPQKNENDKVYYIANVTTEDGESGRAILWENLLTSDKLPKNTFSVGTKVRVAIQLKGDYAGNATIELPLLEEKVEKSEHQKEKITPPIETVNEDYFEESISSFKTFEDKNIGYKKDNSKNSNPSNTFTYSSATKTSNNKEEIGCGKLFLIFAFSFIVIGFILSPLSFLGFILYPIWVGGAFLLTKFLANIFNP